MKAVEYCKNTSLTLLRQLLLDAGKRVHALGWGSQLAVNQIVRPSELGIDWLVIAFLTRRDSPLRLYELTDSIYALIDVHCGDTDEL